MWVDQTSNNSFNFIAPASAAASQEVLFPAYELQAPAYAAILAVTINQSQTFLTPATLTGAMTINLTINAQVTPGAEIILSATSDGTARTITFGTGFTAPALAGVITKTLNQTFVYNGTAFVPKGASLQIN